MRIYLDMDGVLCDFLKSASKIVGEDLSVHPQWPRLGKSHCEAIAEQAERFWSNLEWMSEGQELFEGLLQYDVPTILSGHPSSSSNTKHSTIGRRMWLRDNLNTEFAAGAILVPSRDKYLYASNGDVLIDDDVRTITQWRAAGGIGILHYGEAEPTLSALYTVALLYQGFKNG